MGTALRSVLPIDEAIEVLPDLIGMCEDDLDVLVLEVDDGVEGFVGHVLRQQVC